MSTGITYLNKEVYTNEDKRTVAAKLDFIVKFPSLLELPHNVLVKITDFLDTYNGKYTNVGLRLQCVGISKASPCDEFDETFGRHIAEDRAYKKANQISHQINKGIFAIISKWFENTYLFPAIDVHDGTLMKIDNLNRSIDNKFKMKFGCDDCECLN